MPDPLHIKTHDFHGQLRYECPHPGCAFDSYTLHGSEGLLLHIARSHKESKQAEPPRNFPTLFDAKGDELKPETPIVGGDSVERTLRKAGLWDREVQVAGVLARESTPLHMEEITGLPVVENPEKHGFRPVED